MPTIEPRPRLGAFFARLLVAAALAGGARPALATAPEKAAASVSDLRDHFAACFQPPALAANTRVTFYFSFNSHGGVIGQPRTTWLGFAGPAQERETRLGQFAQAFDHCLPVPLDRTMAATLPGEVYFLQYVVGPDGRDRQVLLRPFGSHGIGPGIDAGIGPRVRSFGAAGPVGPPIRPFRAFRPHPGMGPFFHPPIVLPFARSRER